jgi:subtilisin family serine protease
MRLSLLLVGLFVSSLLTPGFATAGPRIDRTVQNFLNGTAFAGIQSLPVLVTYKTKARTPNRPAHPRFHAEIERAMIQNTLAQEQFFFRDSLHGAIAPRKTYWIVNGTSTQLNRQQIQGLLLSSSVESITYSKKLIKLYRPAAGGVPDVAPYTYGLEKLNVPGLRQKFPTLDGSGVTVGILDTGIDPTHPDLAGRMKLFKDFTAARSTNASDENGHGTHVAGTIAGGNTSGQSIGVAPRASLIIGKIFDASGSTTDDAIIEAMQWIADPDGDPNTNDFPQLVSNSWGDVGPDGTKDPEEDRFCIILTNWVKLGILPVFAAGNEGPNPGTVGLPGGCPNALAVGATDSNDQAAYFSSRGPVRWKSGSQIKPNVAAPGVSIKSAKPGGGYQSMSGTSMATPHISGVMAILFQASPNMTVDQAAKAIIAGVTDLGVPGVDATYGSGRADVLKSVELIQQGFIRR